MADLLDFTNFSGFQERIWLTAEQTLRKYSNNRLKELGVITKGYKWDFPYDSSYNVRDSNFRLACVFETNLHKKAPHLKNKESKFWTKSRTSITLLLEDSKKTERYIRRLFRLFTKHGFPAHSISYSRQQAFIESTRGYVSTLRLLIDISNPLWGSYGIAKLICHYNDIEQIFLNLQRIGFYESEQTISQSQAQAQRQNIGPTRPAVSSQGATTNTFTYAATGTTT